MKINIVRSKRDMKKFVKFPARLHINSPYYVPPMWIEERTAYYGKNNPILSNSEFELFLLVDNGRTIGRTIAYIDNNHNEFYKVDMGFFGAFECIDDQKAGGMLVKAAEDWCRKKGMESIRGPIHPVAENWGFVYDGYESTPMYMSPWNPPYYHDFFKGYEKAKDLLVYEVDMRAGYKLDDRYLEFFEKFKKRYPQVKFRRINMKNIKDDAKNILDVTNASLLDNWGYVPLELPVMEDMLKKLKLVVNPDAVWILEADGKAIGYCLGFPDINIIFKKTNGRMLPFGWARLLFGAKKLKEYRLFGLAVHPDWQGKGLDAIMYINLYKHLADNPVLIEANYILEDNLRIKNALIKLGMKYTKTYRIYEKKL
jgi:GNAT superfamily N-acetyltransferase